MPWRSGLQVETTFLIFPGNRQATGKSADRQIGGRAFLCYRFEIRGDRDASGAKKRTWGSESFSLSAICASEEIRPVTTASIQSRDRRTALSSVSRVSSVSV